jgi:competence protein ComEC
MGGPIPFLAAFLFGILFHSFFPFERVFSGILWSGLFFGVFVVWRFPQRRRFGWGLLCFLCGFWRFDMTIPSAAYEQELMRQEVIVEGMVGKKMSFWYVVDGAVAVRGLKEVPLYSRVSIRCRLKRVPVSTGFDRRLWFARQGIWFECTPNEMVYVRAASWWNPLLPLRRFREALSLRIRSRFEAARAELLIGILYGSPHFSPEDLEVFRRSGLMHLVAVSGSNISIVVMASFVILLRFGFRRRMAFWLSTISVLMYVCFVGFSASVLRAAIMAWLQLFGRDRGRLVHPVVLLLSCAVVLTIWNPWQLVFDPGFILSFLALIGLFGFARPFQSIFEWVPEKAGLRETVCMTLAATMMTSPYIAYSFGQWSFAGLFTNLIAVPVVPWVMASGACASILPDGMVGVSCRAAATGFLDLIYGVGVWSLRIPFLSGHIPFSFTFMLITYGILFFWMWRMKKSFPQGVSKNVDFY